MALSQVYNSEQGILTGSGDWNPNNNSLGETTLVFNSGTTGDLVLEENGGGVDPDTTVSIDGGPFVSFTFIQTGTVSEGNFDGETYTIIEIDGKEYILLNSAAGAAGGYGGSGTLWVLNSGEPDAPVCFTRGTMIHTPNGLIAIENLSVGDLVTTKQNGACEIKWIRSRKFKVRLGQEPVLIKASALGNARPRTDLLVSPQHRILVSGQKVELLFGAPEALLAAKHLVDGIRIKTMTHLTEVEYFHFMCDSHQVVISNGAYTESMHPGQVAMNGWEKAAQDEILMIFPELAEGPAAYGPTALMALKGFEGRALSSLQG